MAKKVYVDVDLFKKYYLDQNLPIRTCAEVLGVSISTINRCIKANSICKSKDLIYSSIANTNFERYGVANVWQAEEVKHKIKQTSLDVYGVDNPAKADCIKAKAQKTCLERYGVEYTTKVPEFIAKKEQTNLARYGCVSAISSLQVREKITKTNLVRYGVISQFQRVEVKEKVKQTNLNKYGVINQFQVAEFKNKAWKKYTYNEIKFDSTWELALYIYAIDHNEKIIREPKRFSYEVQGKKHFYTPDFLYKNTLIDIKGTHLLKDGYIVDPYGHLTEEELLAKNNCIKNNNIILLTYDDILFALNYVKEK